MLFVMQQAAPPAPVRRRLCDANTNTLLCLQAATAAVLVGHIYRAKQSLRSLHFNKPIAADQTKKWPVGAIVHPGVWVGWLSNSSFTDSYCHTGLCITGSLFFLELVTPGYARSFGNRCHITFTGRMPFCQLITNSIKALKAIVCIQNYFYTGGGILAFLK